MLKKIGMIVPSLYGGGAERSAALLANELIKAGYEVNIYILSNLQITYDLDRKIKIYTIDKKIKKGKCIKNYERLMRIKKIVEDDPIDIIIGYTVYGGIISCILKKITGIKNIVCERQCPQVGDKATLLLRNFLYKKASGAVFQTKVIQQYFYPIVKNSIIIPNILDVKKLPDIIDFNFREKKIVSVGRLVEAKNQRLLISAFEKIHNNFPEYKLEIYGDGPLRTELISLIAKKSLEDKVFLMGRSKEIFERIKTAQIFVLTSRNEGYPNALLEAMGMGLICISTNCLGGGAAALINQKNNGFLIPIDDLDGLVETIVYVIRNMEKMRVISDNAVRVRKSNASEKIIKNWIEYIEKIYKS